LKIKFRQKDISVPAPHLGFIILQSRLSLAGLLSSSNCLAESSSQLIDDTVADRNYTGDAEAFYFVPSLADTAV